MLPGPVASAPSSPPFPQTRSGRRAHAAAHLRYHDFVQRIALRTLRGLPRASVTLDEAVAAGWVGLLDALRRRTAEMNDLHFEAFASYRVRGAILDHLRVFDPLPRAVRRRVRHVSQTVDRLRTRLQRAPEAEEVACATGLSLTEYQQALVALNVGPRSAVGIDAREVSDLASPDALPEDLAIQRSLLQAVAHAVERLPERLRTVLGLYYQEELSFREIGAVLGVTESRACQLHREAVAHIRAQLAGDQLAEHAPH